MTKTDIEWLEYANEFHYGNHPEINTAVQHAIEALQKQEPLRVHLVSKQSLIHDDHGVPVGLCDSSYFECPSCEIKMDFWDEDCYCYGCGQYLVGTDFEDEREVE